VVALAVFARELETDRHAPDGVLEGPALLRHDPHLGFGVPALHKLQQV